jgi:hypothetical protein
MPPTPLVDEDTVRDWMRTLRDEGRDALTRIPGPVNRFPDFVRHLVRRLKALCPAMGKVKIAQHLGRSGLHLAATTVGRMLAREDAFEPSEKAQAADAEAEPVPERAVTAKRSNHVWHADLTVVPTILGGFWSMLSPGTLPQVWPFCWWLALAEEAADPGGGRPAGEEDEARGVLHGRREGHSRERRRDAHRVEGAADEGDEGEPRDPDHGVGVGGEGGVKPAALLSDTSHRRTSDHDEKRIQNIRPL